MSLKLSDAFEKRDGSGEYEWTTKLINVNSESNQEMLQKCTRLGEYIAFCDKVREYGRNEEIHFHEAVCKAVDECVASDILNVILILYRGNIEQLEFEELNEKKYVNELLRKMREEEDYRIRIEETWADVEAARADVEMARTGVEKAKVAALERENEILKSQYKMMRDIFTEYCERKK